MFYPVFSYLQCNSVLTHTGLYGVRNLCWQSPTALTSGWTDVRHAFISNLGKCIWTRTKSLKMQERGLNQQECELHFTVSSPPYLCCALVSDEGRGSSYLRSEWCLMSAEVVKALCNPCMESSTDAQNYQCSIIPHSSLNSALGLGD